MLRKTLIFLPIVLAIVACMAAKQGSPGDERDKVLIRMLIDGLNELHFAPGKVDNKFSEKVYELHMKNMDYTKRFYTQEDVKQLKEYREKVDDEVRAASFEFFKLSLDLFDKRFGQTKGWIDEILAKPVNLHQKEVLQTDPEKLDYVKNEKELRTRWEQFLTYNVISRVAEMEKEQEKALEEKKADYKTKTLEEMEAEARKKELENQHKWVKRMEKVDRQERMEGFLNAITSTYDPHTNYFAPEEKQAFDIRMSGKLEGIGASLREENGFTKVVSLVPGSPSAKQGELKVNDVILKVQQGDAEPVEIVDMELDEVVKQVRGPKGTTVRLHVKKPDGTLKTISIVRDVVIMDEGFAKSAIIEDKEHNKRIGFIHLPSFYADFNDRNGRRCADDVKKEVEKLVAEKVDGIAIDLRFNGGGSLNDVVDMSGLFIKDGPIVQVKGREALPQIMPDRDRRIQYNGPLVIMVNQFSASASEIMAAALQDYGRAVIVGGTQTFGKGTVQRFISLDDAIQGMDEMKPLGSVKMTFQKFYRVNGGSTQLRGVTPDIVLPDVYNYRKVGEREEDYPMAWSEIPACNYTVSNSIPNLGAIKAQSKARVEKNETFQKIESYAKWLKSQEDNTKINLDIEKYRAQRKEIESTSKQYENINKDLAGIEIVNIKADQSYLDADSSRVARFAEWHKNIKKDAYIGEVVNILNDMMAQTSAGR